MPSGQLVYDILARDRASKVLDKVGRSAETAGNRTHKFGLVSKASSLAAGAGLGALAIQSIKSAASFETTMRQIAVATKAPASSIQGLSKLALKMGQDTVFSAQDAGDAMLELAKSGMTEADIRAGALAQTLTLATAGSLELGNAAAYISSGLHLFNLQAGQSGQVAAALAGAANASTASVEDMGLALSQVGPGAHQAGLSLQETTAALALFANSGIKGSDAGTSLKVMLQRLVPQTDKAKGKMEDLGLSFVGANGQFKDLDEIAQNLHDSLNGLSESQRTVALNTIFGSDASRAAAILMKAGAKGVDQMVKATSDLSQAQKLSKATTSGTAGALSQLSGSVDTAKLALGTALAPLVVKVAGHLTGFANTLGTDVIPTLGRFIDGMDKGTGPGGQFAGVLGDLGDAAHQAWDTAKPLFGFIGNHPKLFAEVAKDAGLLALALKGISTVKKLPGLGGLGGGKGGLLGGITKAAPLPVFVTNQGVFGGAGGGKTPPIIPGGGTKAPGRFSRGLNSTIGQNVVLAADVVLAPEAVNKLKNTVFPLKFNLSVNDAAKEFLDKLQSSDTDAVTKTVLQRHFNAVFAGVAEAAKSGNTKTLQKALLDTDLDLQRHDKQILAQHRKDAVAEQATLDRLLMVGMDEVKAASEKTGKAVATNLGPRLSTAAIRSRDKMIDLRDAIRNVPDAKPKVDLIGAPETYGWTQQIYGGLLKVDSKHAKPTVSLPGAHESEAQATRLEAVLDRLNGKHVKTIVDVRAHFTGFGRPAADNQESRRAGGGPVVAGEGYWVGDRYGMRNAEWFQPATSGHIYTQQQLARMTGASGSTAPQTVIEKVEYHAHEAQAMPEPALTRAMANVAYLLGS